MRAVVAVVVGTIVANVVRDWIPNTSLVFWTIAGLVVGAFLVGLIAQSRAWLLGCIMGALDAAVNGFLVWFVWSPTAKHPFPITMDQPLGRLLVVEPVLGLVVAELVNRIVLYLGIRRRSVSVLTDTPTDEK